MSAPLKLCLIHASVEGVPNSPPPQKKKYPVLPSVERGRRKPQKPSMCIFTAVLYV